MRALLCSLSLSVFQLACNCSPSPPETVVAPPEIHRFAAELMGTRFEIAISTDDGEGAAAAADKAFKEIDQLEKLLSEYLDSSEIGRLNAASGAAVQVSETTVEVLRRAVALADATRGAFDPTWAAMRGLWKFDVDPPRLPKRSEVEAALARIGYGKIRFGPDREVRLADGAELGLGAIAKGYATDRAAESIRRGGFADFVVDAGGDLYIAGKQAPDRPWTVKVRHPRKPTGTIADLSGTTGAVVTSGDYQRYFELGGKRWHHIIDLRTGKPAEKSVAVTVVADEAWHADALATALFVLGPEEGMKVVRAMRGVQAAILAPDGSVAATDGLRDAFGSTWNR